MLCLELAKLGIDVDVIAPDRFATLPCPSYPEIRLALTWGDQMGRSIEAAAPDCIHIATEGPLGLAARRWCLRRGFPFTTAYHTRFPEYLSARAPVPLTWGYAWMRRFHGPSSGVMVATPTLLHELEGHGLRNLRQWTRGVDTALFRPRVKTLLDLPRPIYLYVGRTAVEKNIGAFLDMDVQGTKLVVGDGPQRASLEARYPKAIFVGMQRGEALARYYAASDVFVFPSRTDTFGLVQLEALASGLPVAAYPVAGPLDVIGDSGAGVLSEDLAWAARQALRIAPQRCRDHACRFSWEACARSFIGFLQPMGSQCAWASRENNAGIHEESDRSLNTLVVRRATIRSKFAAGQRGCKGGAEGWIARSIIRPRR